MDEQTALDILSGRRRGVAASAVRAVLGAASLPYSAAMRLRRWAYRKRLLPAAKAHAPVICIGNITTGGTGKTPMVAWAVEHLTAEGHTPAILTRGYKARAGESDEAELLKALCPRAAVVVNADRIAGAREALAGGVDVLVMDDGFQHRRLRRDLDIVLIDATCPFGFGRCLPRGLLREPLSALADADAVVLTRSDAVPAEDAEALEHRLRGLAPKATLHRAIHEPAALVDETGQAMPTAALSDKRVLAFCGIGNPSHFFRTVAELGANLGANLVASHPFADHVDYTDQLLGVLAQQAEACGAEVLVTTQKDAVKLHAASLGRPIWSLAVRMKLTAGEASLRERLRAVFAARR